MRSLGLESHERVKLHVMYKHQCQQLLLRPTLHHCFLCVLASQLDLTFLLDTNGRKTLTTARAQALNISREATERRSGVLLLRCVPIHPDPFSACVRARARSAVLCMDKPAETFF